MADDNDVDIALSGVQSPGYVNEPQQLNSSGIPVQYQIIQFDQSMDNGSNPSISRGTFNFHQQDSDEPFTQHCMGSTFANLTELSMLETENVFNMDSFENPDPAVHGIASTMHETASYSDFDAGRTPWGSLSDKPSRTLDTVDDLMSEDFDALQGSGHPDNPHCNWLNNMSMETEPTFSNAGSFDQGPVPTTPFSGSYQPSYSTTSTDPLSRLGKTRSILASTSPGIESVEQFVGKASDGPWTPFTARRNLHGDVERNIPSMNLNGVPVSENNPRSDFVVKDANLMAFNSPFDSSGQGMGSEFQHPRDQVPRRRRRKSALSAQTVPQYRVGRSDRNAAVSKPRHPGLMPTQNKPFRSLSHSLPVPGSSMPTSPSPSNTRMASSAVDQVLLCGRDGCTTLFTGVWAKGNRERHWRSKHGVWESEDKPFPCLAEGCSKAYERPDARLRHHRKCHPELRIGPAVPRRKNDGLGEN